MKLIILNGSPATGKSTVAGELHRDLPMSLLADVDEWRKSINGWRENKEESLRLVYEITVAIVDTYLQSKNSVIVDKAILSGDRVINSLIETGKKYNAEIFEFILTAEKEVTLKRAEQRGFHENGLLTPKRVVELWDIAQELIKKRSNAIVIDTSNLTPEEVYQKIKSLVL
jgi:predicted kinase